MNVYDGLKSYILNKYNALVEELSTPDIPLVPVEDRHCTIGDIDLDRLTAKHVVAIMPMSETYEPLTVGSNEVQSQVEVYIFVGKESPQMLYKQASMLGTILKKAIYFDPTLDGLVEDCRVTQLDVFQGVEGSPDRQAIVITLEMIYEELTEE